MKTERALSIVKMLTEKGSKRQGMGMVHHSLRGIDHAMPEMQPTVAQFPILSGSPRVRHIKSSDGTKLFGRERQITRREKSRIVRNRVVEQTQIGDQ